MTQKTWTAPLEEDPETGDLLLTFPNELLEQTGWKPGCTLLWTVLDSSNTVTLTKVDNA